MSTTVLPPLGDIPARDSLRFTPPYTEDALDQLRTQGDPMADDVVAALAAEGALTGFHDLLGVVRERAAHPAPPSVGRKKLFRDGEAGAMTATAEDSCVH